MTVYLDFLYVNQLEIMSELYYNNLSKFIKGEEWKIHPIYTTHEGSNFGRIRNIHTKRILKQRIGSNGRLSTCLWLNNGIKTISPSRFILSCFSGKEETDLQCDHINANFLDNKIENLRWVTAKENANNINSLKKYNRSIPHNNHKRGVMCYDKNGELINVFNSVEEAANFCSDKTNCKNINSIKKCIYYVLVGKRKSTYGYVWKRIENGVLPNEMFKKHPTLNIEVSNKGRVKFFSRGNINRITYGTLNKITGYLTIWINGRHYAVHRLVAETFIQNTKNKPEVNHINADKKDNCIENLEWCDRKENLLSEYTHKKVSIVIDVFTKDGVFVKTFSSIRMASRELGLYAANIARCLSEKHKYYKTCGGYIFKKHNF